MIDLSYLQCDLYCADGSHITVYIHVCSVRKGLTLILLNCLFLFFIISKLELLTQYPASNRRLGAKGSYLTLVRVADRIL